MTISQSLQGDLETLARACRVLDMEEHTDLTQGHLSMRDPVGRGVWMKRRGISLRQVRSLDDMVLISWEGKLLDGDGPMHLEWPIHTEIMLARPDINAVGHTHPFHASIFSATNEALRRYELTPYAGRTVLFRPPLERAHAFGGGRVINADREFEYEDNDLTSWIPDLSVHEIACLPGDHDGFVLEPYVRDLATQLRTCMVDATQSARPHINET